MTAKDIPTLVTDRTSGNGWRPPEDREDGRGYAAPSLAGQLAELVYRPGGQGGGSALIAPGPRRLRWEAEGVGAICGSSCDSSRVVITPPVGKSQDDRDDQPQPGQAPAEFTDWRSKKEADDG
jgi:hypothetical protein